MKRATRSTNLFVFLIAALLATPLAAQESSDASFERAAKKLKSRVDAVVTASDASRGKVGVYVAEVDSGRALYSRQADEPMNPASNVKLITAAAALDHFGPQHTFKTELLAPEVDADGTVDGSLYIRGEGEAFLLFEDLLDWAGQLRLDGVERIDGDIVIDDSVFDGTYMPPGFDQKDSDASYRSPIGAVSVNFNAILAIVAPGEKAGEPARCRLVPPNDHIELVNRVTTTSGKRRHVSITAEPTEDGGTRLVVDGRIGQHAAPFQTRRKRIDNPPRFAGAVFVHALQMVGVEFDGEVRLGETPDDVETLVRHTSQPLSYVLLAMNKWSNNFMAEQVFRTLGVSDDEDASTWEASRAVVMAFLEKAGVDTDGLAIHNGSGLYDGNLVSPRQFVQLLRYMNTHPMGPEFASSLAIAGTDGTLERRLRGEPTAGNVRGKTGTLNEVVALSGYMRTESGRLVAFSIIVNDPPRRAWHYRPLQDRIVEAIAGFDG